MKAYLKRIVYILMVFVLCLSLNMGLTGCGMFSVEDPGETSSASAIPSAVPTSSTAVTPSLEISPTPVLTPEPTPTPEPTVKPTPADKYSVFANSVFVGDSVSLKLELYAKAMRKSDPSFMSNAQFLTAGSLSARNAIWPVSDESVHPTYMGKKQLIEDSIAQMGNIEKVFIMLGLNDIGINSLTQAESNMETLVGRIMEKSPNVRIYIQSMTPTTTTTTLKKHTVALIDEYNALLKSMCANKGWVYLDVQSVLRDTDGHLIRSYCSDPNGLGIHFTEEACQVWVDYLVDNLN